MPSLSNRVKSLLYKPASGLARRVSPTMVPRRWANFAIKARITWAKSFVRDNPLRAQKVLDPLLTSSNNAVAWQLTAQAWLREKEYEKAHKAVRTAVEMDDRSVATAILYWRIAIKTRDPEEIQRALQTLGQARPRNNKELRRVVDALRTSDRKLASHCARHLESDPETEGINLDPLYELVDEFFLEETYNQDHENFPDERERVLQESSNPIGVVAQALMRCRAWDELAEFVATTSLSSGRIGPRGAARSYPLTEIKQAAEAALTAGAATATTIIAARVLPRMPNNKGLRATYNNARDQLSVVRRGWAYPQAADTPYERDPKAVLSVLSQSLPITSGGYATRSHGIITSVASRGWNMRAVTRLGFPYDRWKPQDKQVVPESDVVDGVTYHRLLEEGVREYPQYPLASYIERFTQGVDAIANLHRASLIHASSFYVAGMAGLTAARNLGLPFIYEMRGLEELMKVSRDPAFAGSDRHKFLDLLETGLAKEADTTFVITRSLRDEMIKRGVPEEKLIVVPNGVHTANFQPSERDRDLEAELGLRDKTVIGYVGGIVDYEGLDVLMDAVAGLKETRNDVHVLIVGDGAVERRIHEHANRLRLGDIVTFTGRVPHDQVPRYLSLVDIAPFPRLPLPVCELISPIKPFESMAMGKAIVVSDVAALTEFVDDGVTGRTFRKGDADDLRRVLEQLLDSEEQRKALGKAAREWVIANRDWSNITSIVDEAYASLTRQS